jgi:hypothetical protein
MDNRGHDPTLFRLSFPETVMVATNNRGSLIPASIEMLTKCWDDKNAPAAMMMNV